jgi:hypothetical protein
MIANILALRGTTSVFDHLRAIGVRLFEARRNRTSHVVDRAAEAEQLREFALDFVKSDPGFAADLFAAADRHERTSCHTMDRTGTPNKGLMSEHPWRPGSA